MADVYPAGSYLGNVQLNAGSNCIGSVTPTYARSAGVLHRDSITVADKLIVDTAALVSLDVAGEGHLVHATTYKSCYAPGNLFGTAGLSAIGSEDTGDDGFDTHAIDLTIPQVVGAVYYDIFLSVDAAPLWVGRVTEAQRAAGASITAVGTVTSPSAGVVAGDVRVEVPGTGIATGNIVFTVNNAYTTTGITGIVCTGYFGIAVHISVALTDLRVAPSLTIVLVLEDDAGNQYVGDAETIPIMNGAVGQALKQVHLADTESASKAYILIGSLTGQGAAVTIRCELV